jgi:AcrR family transcriptional regulator
MCLLTTLLSTGTLMAKLWANDDRCNTNQVKTKKRPYHHGHLRAALLSAAELELESGNSDSLSLRELSRSLGVSYTAPRRHFANKQALLDALALEGFERLGATLNRAIADRSEDFDQRMTKLARTYVRWAMKHSALIRLMVAAKHKADAPAALLEASNRALSAGPLTIADGQASGAVVEGDPLRLALTVFSAAEGLIAICANGEFNGVPIDRLVVEIVQQIILGIRPR